MKSGIDSSASSSVADGDTMPDPAGRPFIHDDKETFAAARVLAEARLGNVARALIE